MTPRAICHNVPTFQQIDVFALNFELGGRVLVKFEIRQSLIPAQQHKRRGRALETMTRTLKSLWLTGLRLLSWLH